jgi:hypothetical protein
MTATVTGHEPEMRHEETTGECAAQAAEELTVARADGDSSPSRASILWIGTMRNPRVGPLVVLDDTGYLVPLCTAGDLLRGCRYFWRTSQD